MADYLSNYSDLYSGLSSEVNKYADELISQAKGDYDFAAKWIEANYKVAMGTDDVARQAFLKKVASSLEEKVGRIQYDYDTKTYRLGETTKTDTQRLNENTATALNRLAEDEKAWKEQNSQQTAIERQAQSGNLNQRGLVSGTRGQAQGLYGKEVGNFEKNATNKLEAYQRSVDRSKQDTLANQTRGLEDINRNQLWGQQDIATDARRSSQDATMKKDYSIESAQRAKDAAVAAAERERRAQLNQAKALADQLNRLYSNLS